ncbi:MAG: hypothetical protein K0R69_2470 [Clostridia bacterium]|jgi:hypothetical protein|nr:hypothetical protein [Clostridia bacterium]
MMQSEVKYVHHDIKEPIILGFKGYKNFYRG